MVAVMLQVMAAFWQLFGVGGWCRLLEPSFEPELSAVVLHVTTNCCRWREWCC